MRGKDKDERWWLRRWKNMGTKGRWWDTIQVWKKDQDQSSTSRHLPPSLSFSPLPPPTPSYVPVRFPIAPALPHTASFYPPLLPSCPFFTHLPTPLLLLTPSLGHRLLIRAGGTIVPSLPVFGNPGLKQSLFTQAVAQPGPSPSLQLGQVWLSLFHKCYNKPLSQPRRLMHSPLPFRCHSISFSTISSSIFLL